MDAQVPGWDVMPALPDVAVTSRTRTSPPEACFPVEQCVARCQKGDAAAFHELFSRYYTWVQGIVFPMVHNPADLDDVVQSVFLEVHRSIGRFEGRSRFSTWLTRLAINVALGYRRKRRFWRRTEEALELEGLAGAPEVEGPPGPDEVLQMKVNRQAVHRLTERLSPKRRSVFMLAELQGMESPEIGAVLGIPPATVRTRLFHARREFEQMVREDPQLGGQVSHATTAAR
ncbi:MAG: RNA polymerase sigma factor [Myxococcota bacterium]